jgi:hypothetical protein
MPRSRKHKARVNNAVNAAPGQKAEKAEAAMALLESSV